MKTWTHLQSGDVVDIIAPASHTSQVNLDLGAEWLRSLGLVPRIGERIIEGDVFFAAPLEVQLEHLKKALYSDSKAIWCIRGGYGSMRLIPYLKRLRPPKKPKLLLGFSDITSLHLFFTQSWGWPTFHSRNISAMKSSETRLRDRVLLKEAILGKKTHHTFKNLIPLNEAAAKTALIQGKITGGNLRILQSSLKTDWELKAKGKILFLEDVGERGYSVHRMLEQMIQAKLIHRGVKAVILGDFTEGEEKNGKNLIPEAVKRFANEVPYPVLKGLPCGHAEINFPLPFNTDCELKLGRRAELEVSFGGVSSFNRPS